MTDETQSMTGQGGDDDLLAEYANGVYIDPSVWDVTLIFGKNSPRVPGHAQDQSMDWSSAITVPWSQAKLMAYFLLINIAVHEDANGEIALPPAFLPPRPPIPNVSVSEALQEKLGDIHDRVIGGKWSKANSD